MRTSTIRSLVVGVSCMLLAAWTPGANAETCPKICNQKSTWGSGPAPGYLPCECTTIISGRGSGANGCDCGVCYQQTSAAKVTGFAKVGNGECPTDSTNCGDCDLASGSGSGSGSNATKTTAPPNGTTGTTPANSTTTAPSATTDTSTSNEGLQTWQIALIICSCVLVMAVVMMTITSCYCKARSMMKDNMQNEEERHEYEGYWNPNASGGITERSGNEQLAQSTFNPGMTLGGRSSFNSTHSRPNSTKNMPYSEPTYAVDDRIGAGMNRPPARQSIGNSGDLPGVFQPFPQREARPSHEVGSRKNIAIEL